MVDYGGKGGIMMQLRSNLMLIVGFLTGGVLLAATGRAAGGDSGRHRELH